MMTPFKEEFPPGEFPEKFNIAAHFLGGPAALHPGRPAIAGEPPELSYGELAALANRAGNALRAQGVSRGDRVLIALPDTAGFIAAFFGTAKIGAVAVPVNPFARACRVSASFERAPASADCRSRRRKNKSAQCLLRKLERLDRGSQRPTFRGGHFAGRFRFPPLYLRQRRRAQSSGASPCGYAGHQPELRARRPRPARR